jgi:Flp pilus assembly protein TadD
MSRMPTAAATALLLAVAAAPAPAPAGVLPWGKREAATPKPAAAEPAPESARRAGPEARAAAARLDPLGRVAFWTRETTLDPRDAEAGVALAEALRALGRNEEAAQTAERVLMLQPAHVEALLELARAQLARNQGFYAIEPAKKAQAAAPRDWRALSLLGVAYEQVGRGAEAKQAWQTALKLSPDNPAVLANLALQQAAGGDLGGAETLLRRAAAKKDAPVKVRQNLVVVLGLQGKLQEAEKLAREDLPPEAASANLAWLRSAAPASGRSWDTLKAAPSAVN